MQRDKTYTFGEIGVTFHQGLEDFHFEESVLADPETTENGNWEVWKLDREGENEAKSLDDIEFVPSDRLLEIHTKETLSQGAVFSILSALQIGFELGEASGANRTKRSLKFALSSLTGEIDSDDLDEAAEQNAYRKLNQRKP